MWDLDWAMDRIAELVKKTRDETFIERLDERQAREQHAGHLLARRRHDGQRVEPRPAEADARPGRRRDREPGPDMTQLQRPRSGDRLGRGAATRPAQPGGLRLHHHHGLQHGRVPPGRVPLGDEGEACNGAKVIHVDPRFTRTAAMADIYAPIRAGSDIAFLGGLIRYVITTNAGTPTRSSSEYVVNYTNAATIIDDEFQDTEDLDGVFSGLMEYTAATEWPINGFIGQYDNTSVAVRAAPSRSGAAGRSPRPPQSGEQTAGTAAGEPAARPAGAEGGRRAASSRYDALVRSLLKPPPETRPDAPGPALRLPDRQAALRAVHAGDGGAGDRLPPGDVPQGRRDASWPTPAPSGPRRSATPSAGPSTPTACRSSAAARSSSCCSGTSAGRAAASWRSGATPRSRAPPTCHALPLDPRLHAAPRPRCKQARHAGRDYLAAETLPRSYWANFPKFMVSYLKSMYGDAATRRTTSATTGTRRSSATTRTCRCSWR